MVKVTQATFNHVSEVAAREFPRTFANAPVCVLCGEKILGLRGNVCVNGRMREMCPPCLFMAADLATAEYERRAIADQM